MIEKLEPVKDGCVSNNCACKMRTGLNNTYKFKKLSRKEYGGIYECNSRCSCAKESFKCGNRVVQQGIKQPLGPVTNF